MLYDAIVIGGGVTGAGVLRDLSLRGYKALLLEKNKPGFGTTVTSTHLIHGGLRYLLYDRLTTHATCWDSGHIVRIARPLLTRLPILWPVYRGHQHGLETVQTLLESYDGFQAMKGGLPHLRLSAEETRRVAPGLSPDGLKGGLVFDEWWVDPVALVEANLASARTFGAETRVGASVDGLLKTDGRVTGVRVKSSDGRTEDIAARLVINAAGPWADGVARLAGLEVPLRLRKGTHLVYDRPPAVLAGPRPVGLLLEAEDRERYVFVVPGPGMTLVGPTDLATPEGPDRLTSSPEEIRYLLASVRRYFPSFPENFDRTVAGARPILGQKGSEKLLSREFEVLNHGARDGVHGFITVAGGKMSDFRLMGQEAGDLAGRLLGRDAQCHSHLLTLANAPVGPIPDFRGPSKALKKFLRAHPRLRELHALAYLGGGLARHAFRRLSGRAAPAAGVFEAHYAA